ncbi:MAG: PD-(D/E)XK nuclease family transposase [Clostridiales bacterium]|nr:PD-(D/E)XK nuclease family transposase [Clostridiales bacterium]
MNGNRKGTRKRSDLTEIDVLDLSRLPVNTDNSELWYWLEFMKSNNEEVLEMIAERSPQMRKAVGFLKELSADEQTRLIFESHETARRDMLSRLDGAELKGRLERNYEIARNLLRINLSATEIAKATGLSLEEVELLKQ